MKTDMLFVNDKIAIHTDGRYWEPMMTIANPDRRRPANARRRDLLRRARELGLVVPDEPEVYAPPEGAVTAAEDEVRRVWEQVRAHRVFDLRFHCGKKIVSWSSTHPSGCCCDNCPLSPI